MPEATTMTYIASDETVLTPHLYKDGKYVASKTRFKKDYVRVESLSELIILARRGFRIRMSNTDITNHRAPSLVIPTLV